MIDARQSEYLRSQLVEKVRNLETAISMNLTRECTWCRMLNPATEAKDRMLNIARGFEDDVQSVIFSW